MTEKDRRQHNTQVECCTCVVQRSSVGEEHAKGCPCYRQRGSGVSILPIKWYSASDLSDLTTETKKGRVMGKDVEVKQAQLERMSTEQIAARMQQSQEELDMFLGQLFVRASIQEYTEQQYDGLVTLLQEALTFLEELSPLPLEWGERRNKLMDKLKKEIGKDEL